MQDLELDDLLRRSAPAPPAEADEAAVLLARQMRGVATGAEALGPRSRSRPSLIATAAVAGALALTGAGTVTAYQLSIPPFQTLEDGVGRTVAGVPVDYRNSVGRQVRCLAFIEYRHLDAAQRNELEEVVRDGRWQGYGQRVLDRLAVPGASPEAQNAAIIEAVHDDLWGAAKSAVPSMAYMRPSDGPVYAGSSMSCAEPGGVDGRP